MCVFIDAKGLTSVQEVEQLREKVYATLEEYCKTRYPEEPGRFAKLLLRLPALRSIGLKCLEHLFFFKLIGDTPIDTFLMEMLETPSPASWSHGSSLSRHLIGWFAITWYVNLALNWLAASWDSFDWLTRSCDCLSKI